MGFNKISEKFQEIKCYW